MPDTFSLISVPRITHVRKEARRLAGTQAFAGGGKSDESGKSQKKGDAVQNKDGKKSALSRRAFVGKLATGAAGAAVALAAGAKGAEALSKSEQWPSGHPGDIGQSFLPSVAPAQAEPRREAAAAVVKGPSGPTVLPPDAPPPWELLKPLAKGAKVVHGWRVSELSPVVDGSFVVTLENERGRAHRVHVCRNDGRPAGLVYTQHLDLVVMNGGRGDLPTEEGLAQAVAEVAHVLAANEGKWRGAPMMTALLPQAERMKKFGAAAKLR